MRQRSKTAYTFSGKGKCIPSLGWGTPAGFEQQSPYTVALIKLQEGPIVTAQLTDLGDTDVEIGMPVEMVTRKLRDDTDERGIIVYGYKFRPVMVGYNLSARIVVGHGVPCPTLLIIDTIFSSIHI